MRRRTLLHGEGLIDIASAVVIAASQAYDGTAKTPAVTVTLHGSVIDAANYDVTYSNNTNAGTAYITVTGKGDYTGTTAGTFNIAKAAPSYTAPTAKNPTYNSSSQYLTTTGTTAHGTIQYSADGSSWSVLPIARTNAGGYTTYWRLVGDANHTSIGATSITTYINKASRTLSFPSSYAVLDHGGTVTRAVTVLEGAGDGTVTYSVGSTTYASVVSASGKVTAKSTDGSTTITATISEGTNYFSASASYTLYVFSTAAHDYSYNGSYHSVTLPPGRYNLQVWGAQGGSNAADSSYGITAQAGGKGGYSEGVLTLTSATNVRVYVGGAGSSSAGGYNGGGSTTGSASYSSGDTYGTSRMGGGGGATDIRLSDGALLSRMIVAGGGSGGAMCYKEETTSGTVYTNVVPYYTGVKDTSLSAYDVINDVYNITAGKKYRIKGTSSGSTSYTTISPTYSNSTYNYSGNYYISNIYNLSSGGYIVGDNVRVRVSASGALGYRIKFEDAETGATVISGTTLTSNSYTTVEVPSGTKKITVESWGSSTPTNFSCTLERVMEVKNIAYYWYTNVTTRTSISGDTLTSGTNTTLTAPSNATVLRILMRVTKGSTAFSLTSVVDEETTTSTTTTSNNSQVGYVGGGTTGGGYSSTYQGKQNGAGTHGSFGQGANQTTTNYRYCSGAGGGGWYGGGGRRYSDSDMNYCKQSGGGSGFVNTAANASYRPSGYTGLELDSGTTYDGNQSFPAVNGGNETGHAGNGYARITRIA